MNIDIKTRDVVITIIRDLKRATTVLDDYNRNMRKSCISCLSFNEEAETCTKFNARPPAKIIAYGCEKHADCDEIPF